MRRIGVHTSIAGGLHLSLERARELGCNTVQIFSHNPRSWLLNDLSEKEIYLFKNLKLKYDIKPIYIHSSYLINIATTDLTLRIKSINMLLYEMKVADLLEADYVILHTGSTSSKDKKQARAFITDALNKVAEKNNWRTGLLIENTSGIKNDLTSNIRDIAKIMKGVKGNILKGICLDTCHAFASGYDIRTSSGINKLLKEIDDHLGFNTIKLIHLNDSKGKVNSKIDRHQHIGLGEIGIKGLSLLIKNYKLKDIPIILETPKKQPTDDSMNLMVVRNILNIDINRNSNK